jgi:predicted membrane protein
MKIVATRTTALAAGVWTTLSLTLFDIWERSHYMSHQVSRVVYVAAALILWAVPAILFVVGFDRKRWDPNYAYEPGAQADYREIGMRRGCPNSC